jgi:transcriptional regulator with XRE-family HTH domain
MAAGEDDPALQRIRDELDRRGWSQRTLSDRTVLGESTIFRLLKGDYSRKTLRKVEEALGIAASGPGPAPIAIADIRYGGYLRALYGYYEGEYRLLRPAFADPSRIALYPFRIVWCDESRALAFADGNPGYEQKGVVAVPTGTQFIHFLTLANGSVRLITAYHAPPGERAIRGLLLTFANPRGRELYPAAAPVLIVRKPDKAADPLEGVAGLLPRTDPRIAAEVGMLDALALDPVLLNSDLRKLERRVASMGEAW